MKKINVNVGKLAEVGSIVLTALAGGVATIVASKKQKKLIDEAVVKHLAEKK